MTFNIRKLKIQIECTKRELRECDPRSRDRLRLKLKRQERALEIAKEARALRRMAA
jgi:hypothetical protein